jgi:prepilin-type N-terminal cleavage/methylation domain-containing protein
MQQTKLVISSRQKGVSLIELLLVMAIIAVIGATATPFISSFVLRNNYETTVDQLQSTLRKAQGYAMNGKNGSTWGVCFTSNTIRLYRGSCVAPVFAENFKVPGTVTVSGLSDTTFSLQRGEPTQPLTITISTAVGSRVVTLNAVGMIESN